MYNLLTYDMLGTKRLKI